MATTMTSSSGKVIVALYQACCNPGDIAANISVMKEQMKRASLVGAALIIFPETFTTGYHLPEGPTQFKQLAEPQNGASFQELAATAKQLKIAVIYGYPEVVTNGHCAVYYNSCQFIDEHGVSLANYRKTHLWPLLDKEVFTQGEGFADLVEFHGLKIGLLICYDVEFPENVRHLALQGANFIAVPTAVGHPYSYVTNMVAVRAMENQIFLAYVNHCGVECGIEMMGHSCCCGPREGVVMAAGTAEGTLLLATIDPDECVLARERFSYVTDRRPELYKNIGQ